MKNFKYVMMLMIFGAAECMYASQPTATATTAGSMTIYNKSNMPIIVAFQLMPLGTTVLYGTSTAAGATGTTIPAGATATMAYSAGDVIGQIAIFYNKQAYNPTTDGQIIFSPTGSINGASLYVYGNSSFAPGTIDTTTATPVPARFAAWWTGNIPVATDTTAALAIADTNVAPLVTMHVANLTDANDFGLTGANAAF